MSQIQSVLFDKNTFSEISAKEWLNKHNFKYGKVDKRGNKLRFRHKDPEIFDKIRTKKLMRE